MSWGKAGKVLVVCSSLLLGCGYVGYRHQQQLKEPGGDKAVLPGSKNPNRMTVLPSSKNIDAVLSHPNRRTSADFISPDAPAGKPEERTLLPGSKRGAMIGSDDVGAINRDTIDGLLNQRPQHPPPEEDPPP